MVICAEPVVIDKVWGHEIVNENHELFCSKKLMLKKGAFCSYHCHKLKLENFSLIAGHIRLEVEEEMIDMLPGMSKTIFPGFYHRFAGYVDSEIFEASTHHRDDDSYRKEESYLARRIYAIDIDGTLENCGGCVKREHLIDKDIVVVSSKSRTRSREACEDLGIYPLEIINSRILSKTEELRYVDRLYPLRRTLYIGDQESDRSSAEKAGWQFMSASEFADLESIENGC